MPAGLAKSPATAIACANTPSWYRKPCGCRRSQLRQSPQDAVVGQRSVSATPKMIADQRSIGGTQGQGLVEIVAYSGSQSADFVRRAVQRPKTRQSGLDDAKVGNFTPAQVGKITSVLTTE
jgi:hypothetical protein